MFDHLESRPAVLTADDVRAWVTDVARAGGPEDDRGRLDLITALEELKGAAEGLQADLAVEVDASMRRRAADRGVPAARQGQGVAAEIALARRSSLHRGQQDLGLAKVLRRELPFTRVALRSGRINGWRATIIARETACLSRADRVDIDRRIAGDADRLAQMGDRELGNAVRRLSYERDPESWVTRRRIAESERRVTLRPPPDVMSRLSAELPVAQGVAVFKTLSDHADTLRASGDPRSRGQLMADTLVSRLLGTEQGHVLPVMTHVVVSDEVLFRHARRGRAPRRLRTNPGRARPRAGEDGGEGGAGPAAPPLRHAEDRRPGRCRLRSRFFPAGLGRLIELRGQFCRTPWCDAPIRHHDHLSPAAADGETSERNGQGLCEACNYAKQAVGWRARPSPGGRHTVEITTPSGRRYRSTSPPLPRQRLDHRYPVTIAA